MSKLDYNIDSLYPNTVPESMDADNPSFQNTFTEGVGSAINSGQFIGNTTVEDGYLQSSNFVTGSTGWRLSPTTAELNVSTALASLDIPDTTTANSFHVDSSGNAWWGTNVATGYATAPAKILNTGAGTFSSITITGGSITGTPIASIPNSTATDISLLDFTHDLVFSETDADTVAWASGTITMSNARTFSITGSNTGNMTLKTYIYLDTGVSSTALQTTTTVATAMGANKKLIAVAQNGTGAATWQVNQGIGGLKITAAMTSVANNDWAYSGTWSVTDADTVAWGAGTLTTSNGGSYSITGSNTGNMVAKTYIYFALGTSATAFQTTTTAATAIGEGKILIATAQNATGEAKFIVMNDNQYNIDAANIVAGSITANEIAASTITGDKVLTMDLTSKTITADTGTIGGWTLSTTALTASSGVVGISSAVTGGDDIRFWAGDATPGSAEFRVTESGALTATSATITGAITATSGTFTGTVNASAGTIGGWTINSTSIYTGTEDHAAYTTNSGDITIYSDGADASIHMFNTYIDNTGKIFTKSALIGGWTINSTSIYTGTEDFSGYTTNSGDVTLYSNGSDASLHFFNTYLDTTGKLFTKSATIGGWTIDSTSIYTGTEDHAAYTANAGDITLYSNGTDASIHANKWYIDTAGVLNATAVILDGALTAGASSAINVQYLTAGTISSKSIVLAIAAGTGDAEIRAGIATGDFSNAGAANGFIIGLDDSDGDKVKFYFGNATRNVVFDGTDLTVNGYLVATQGTFGGDGSDGALAITSGTTTISIASAKTLIKNYTSISITSTGKLAFSNPATTGSSVLLKSQGDVTITSTATCIDFSSLGSTGGGPETNGTDSDTGFMFQNDGGQGCIGGINGVKGAGFSITSFLTFDNSSWFRYLNAVIGAGGGGGDTSGGTGGSGGRGGGVGIIECGGAWNFTTASGISMAGANGTDGTGSGSGGGGGGGGGYFVALYKTLTANSGTVVKTGGTGGSGTLGGTGSGGGGSGSGGAGTDGATNLGGTGGVGFSLVAQNQAF